MLGASTDAITLFRHFSWQHCHRCCCCCHRCRHYCRRHQRQQWRHWCHPPSSLKSLSPSVSCCCDAASAAAAAAAGTGAVIPVAAVVGAVSVVPTAACNSCASLQCLPPKLLLWSQHSPWCSGLSGCYGCCLASSCSHLSLEPPSVFFCTVPSLLVPVAALTIAVLTSAIIAMPVFVLSLLLPLLRFLLWWLLRSLRGP